MGRPTGGKSRGCLSLGSGSGSERKAGIGLVGKERRHHEVFVWARDGFVVRTIIQCKFPERELFSRARHIFTFEEPLFIDIHYDNDSIITV